MSLRIKIASVALAVVLLPASSIKDAASAGRGAWYAGLGFGPSRAVFVPQSPYSEEWITGASPQFRLGRFISRSVAVGIESQGYFSEFGTAGDDLPLQIKLRFGAHLWALTATVYPWNQQGPWSGVYFSLGAGPAIANLAGVLADPTEPEGGREFQGRMDEWGWGLFGTAGYEFMISRSFGLGLQATTNHLSIEDEVIRRVWFGGIETHFAWYF